LESGGELIAGSLVSWESIVGQLIGILSANGRIKTVGVQDSNGILSANDRSLLVSGKEQQHSKLALLSGRSSHWRFRIPINCLNIGAQESGNEQSIYKKLLTGFQIGILQGAKSV
jgi:hypothetical protein